MEETFCSSSGQSFSGNIHRTDFENPQPIPAALVDLVIGDAHGNLIISENQNLAEVLGVHRRTVLFAVPGAFTPTCSSKHLPGFVGSAELLANKGVDAIYCLSVNDRYVMKAWAEMTHATIESGIIMVADGNADFTRSVGMVNDRSSSRMGIRSKRYAMVIENGKIVTIMIDETGYGNSSAESVLSFLSSD